MVGAYSYHREPDVLLNEQVDQYHRAGFVNGGPLLDEARRRFGDERVEQIAA